MRPPAISGALTILLVRHGEPDLAWPEACDAAAFDAWSAAYGGCGLAPASLPSAALRAQIGALDRVTFMASPIRRAQLSAEILSGGVAPQTLDELREVRLPALSPMPGIKSASAWVQDAILAYNDGQWDGCESPEDLRARARTAAALLTKAASDSAVVAVAHGLINRLVSDALLDAGAAESEGEAGEYWRWQLFSVARDAEWSAGGKPLR